MFVSRKTQVVSDAVQKVAWINLAAAGLSGAARLLLNRYGSLEPDMLNTVYWRIQQGISLLQVVLAGLIFWKAYRILNRCRSAIPKEDYYEMAKLQEEMLPEGVSALSSYSILQLLQIWAGILIGARLVYDTFAGVYRGFIADLSAVFDLSDPGAMEAFQEIYNNTHAFKYLGMLVAIALGIFITGIFLNDRKLKAAAGGLTLLFILTSTALGIGTYTVLNRDVAIVWSSVVFQLLQTFGLLGFSLYLRRNYRGV